MISELKPDFYTELHCYDLRNYEKLIKKYADKASRLNAAVADLTQLLQSFVLYCQEVRRCRSRWSPTLLCKLEMTARYFPEAMAIGQNIESLKQLAR